MDPTALLSALVGAILGSTGWLIVGLYIQRSQFRRSARNACRAVYFELEANQLSVSVAAQYASFTPLIRSTYDNLLPALAAMLSVQELRTLSAAYLGHIGYEQARAIPDLPPEIRSRMLQGVLESHRLATDLLRSIAFTRHEQSAALQAVQPTALNDP